ncbi:DUF4386 domain-containing protein [Aquimarina algicola]|uniref:DUF4386 domain-containing protein n=1 Tax=Aquimarina algicola TaxID=2589995 RepID=A0A504JBS4_9FLAO|nr:DUF4386 domain-containing protein [Aquimarina algicola]TPN84040.1 DUF4386 domain-containing protein [Aquimarina algicola]
MNSNQQAGRIAGILLLFVFISGVTIFQFLQGPVLFSDDFITITAKNSNKIITSILLGIISGLASISIAIILLPIFKRSNHFLAYLYVSLCILNFISIMLDTFSVVSILELSKEYVKNVNYDTNHFLILKTFVYQQHWWTHYLYLLVSCFPVFVLYYTLYISKLVPKVISIFGIIAVLLMFIEELFSIFGHSISMNMLLPIGIIQFILPAWLIYKGLYQSPFEERKIVIE